MFLWSYLHISIWTIFICCLQNVNSVLNILNFNRCKNLFLKLVFFEDICSFFCFEMILFYAIHIYNIQFCWCLYLIGRLRWNVVHTAIIIIFIKSHSMKRDRTQFRMLLFFYKKKLIHTRSAISRVLQSKKQKKNVFILLHFFFICHSIVSVLIW